jgi:hypothetical protein
MKRKLYKWIENSQVVEQTVLTEAVLSYNHFNDSGQYGITSNLWFKMRDGLLSLIQLESLILDSDMHIPSSMTTLQISQKELSCITTLNLI